MKGMLDKMLPRESRPERVGPRVQAMRETLAMTRSELADAIGLDRSSMTRVENGEMGLSILCGERIAVLYGYGLNYIYRGDLTDVPLASRARLMVNLVTHGATVKGGLQPHQAKDD